MRRLGLLVRADRGGLGVQTRDMLAHLEPDAVLGVGMGTDARGPELALTYRGAAVPVIAYRRADVATMDAFLDAIDVLVSVETFYEPYLVIRGAERGVERVLYANPELLNRDDPAERADRYLYADHWEYPFPVPGEVLLFPAPADTITPGPARRPGAAPLRILHVSAPAMLDRDGRTVLLDALHLVTEPACLVIYGPGSTVATWRNERVSVEWRAPVEHHGELYAGVDLQVLPRRYGCLSLPMLEAAAAGVPTLTTDLLPQRDYFAPELLIPAGPAAPHPMKGNRVAGVPVHNPSSADLARAIDALARDPKRLAELGAQARDFAEGRSWQTLRPAWDRLLR